MLTILLRRVLKPQMVKPVYTWQDDQNQAPSKYAFPSQEEASGACCMVTSIESDLETVAGISFYKHTETAGLGAEIEKKWFQDQFAGKKLYANGKPTNFRG